MTIGIVSPAPPGSTLGNSVTADRYAAIFRWLGWRVRMLREYSGEALDCLLVLHAYKSARSALAFARGFPRRPLIVVLTGTDVYRDMHRSRLAHRALVAARAIIALQPAALQELPKTLQRKATAIVQSATRLPRSTRSSRTSSACEVCVIGHLRREKDPLRAAYAVRIVPRTVRVRVTQAGRALELRWAALARLEQRKNGRYRWLGELSRAAARRLLASSDVMVLSSRMEGGANVLCEAIANGVPVLASRIPGNTGIVGRDYPGLYPVGDTKALARLIEQFARVTRFRTELRRRIKALKPLVAPARERRMWAAVLARAAH